MITETQLGDLVTLIKSYKEKYQGDLNIAQGCNCLAQQGAGIAGDFRKFPEIYQADKKFSNEFDFEFTRDKLGLLSDAHVQGESTITVYNCYTQDKYYPRDIRNCNYAAIGSVFLELNQIVRKTKSKTLYIPYIGAGLAGGDWDIISCIINDATPDINVVLIEYVKGVLPKPKDQLPVIHGELLGNGRYAGNIYHDSRFADGTEVITSHVNHVKVIDGSTYIITNNTVYLKSKCSLY